MAWPLKSSQVYPTASNELPAYCYPGIPNLGADLGSLRLAEYQPGVLFKMSSMLPDVTASTLLPSVQPMPASRPVFISGCSESGESDISSVSTTTPSIFDEPEYPSKGSSGHHLGTCRPCAFFLKQGCKSGSECVFCHLCDEGEKSRRKKASKERKRFYQMNELFQQFKQ